MPAFSTLATAATLAALAAAQSASPTPTSSGGGSTQTSALPILYPFGVSIGASVVSSNPDQTVLAMTCLDKTGCPNPSTAAFTVGKSTLAFDYPGNAYSCPVTSTSVTCTLSVSGETKTSTYALNMLAPDALPTSEGIAQAVTISGVSAAATGSSSGSGSGSGSSMPTSTGSSSGSMRPSTSASGSSSASSPSASSSGNAAEHLVAGSGLLGAAALLVGAVVA